MKQLLIIGARGWGREIYGMLPDCLGYGSEFVVKGFLDDKKDVLDGMPGYPPIIDSVENYRLQPDDVFVCALGDTYYKKHYAEMILRKGGRFLTIIHKTASIARNTTIGQGCILCDHVAVSCDIEVADFVTFQSYAIIGHDCKISEFSHLGVRSFMGGFSQIGSLTTLQPHSIILSHAKVGNGCMVGAGSVVLKKVKDGDTVYGNPAKVLKF